MSANATPAKLLAKSVRAGRVITLEAHAMDTERAAAQLFDPTRRWGQSFCNFFRIAAKDRARFLVHLRVAALFHDLGKANEDFLAAVTRRSSEPQALRHEHISALVLHLPEVRTWLETNPQLDHDVITAAVLSHHTKASASGRWKWCQPQGGKESLLLYLQHAEVSAILDRVRQVASLPETPSLPARRWGNVPPWKDAWSRGGSAANALRRSLGREDAESRQRRALLLAVKAGVIAADAASSALVREGLPFDAWINEVAHQPALEPDDIREAILAPRIAQVEKKTGVPFKAQRFQEAAAEQGPRALLLAACGAGKTIAAWKWAEAMARDHEIGRVIFLYPTRGTATEGFRDYVAAAPEGEAALLHGTSRYELEAMAENPDTEDAAERHRVSEATARLFALGHWDRRYFSATVDQFLGFMEHAYSSLCLLPVLADAAVIIDEVHSFDRSLFRSLLAFLESFDIPVLCMTATLPPARREQLERVGLNVYPRVEHREELHDLRKLEEHPRYQIERVGSAEKCMGVAEDAYRRGERVLWVVNQVARAQAIARRLEAALGQAVLCYHSRFRLSDRQAIHRATVEAFQQRSRAAFAVTTQVCEMSLDLDADVLITELAPIPALVQRFGRANRHLARGSGFRARLIAYPPEKAVPYDEGAIVAASAFLEALGEGEISQRMMAEALEMHAAPEALIDATAQFLTGGYYATPGALRDADDFSRPCLLDVDLDDVQVLRKAKKPIDGFVVPVPRGAVLPEEMRPAWLPPSYGVADGARYSMQLGFAVNAGGDV